MSKTATYPQGHMRVKAVALWLLIYVLGQAIIFLTGKALGIEYTPAFLLGAAHGAFFAVMWFVAFRAPR